MISTSKFTIEGLNLAVGECVSNCAHEVDFTREIATQLPTKLKSATGSMWAGQGDDSTLSFSGAYIHQKPYVVFESGIERGQLLRCELGDLLIVMEECVDGVCSYNAALLQLKLLKESNKGIYSIKPGLEGDGRQLKLYTEWPELEIAAKKYRGEKLNVLPKAITPGAEYMIIRKLPRIELVVVSPANQMHMRPPHFGEFLSSFIKWQTGRPIARENSETVSGCRDDWSRLIWHTLDLVRDCHIPGTQYDRVCYGLTWMPEGGSVLKQSNDFEEDFSGCIAESCEENKGFGVLLIRRSRNGGFAFEI